jgi:hypothetical protein
VTVSSTAQISNPSHHSNDAGERSALERPDRHPGRRRHEQAGPTVAWGRRAERQREGAAGSRFQSGTGAPTGIDGEVADARDGHGLHRDPGWRHVGHPHGHRRAGGPHRLIGEGDDLGVESDLVLGALDPAPVSATSRAPGIARRSAAVRSPTPVGRKTTSVVHLPPAGTVAVQVVEATVKLSRPGPSTVTPLG